MTDISSLLTSLTTAGTVAKSLLDIKSIADSAEAKMAIADLQIALVDTKTQVADLKTVLLVKDEQIHTLTEKLTDGSTLLRHNEMYFKSDDGGNPTGDPLCPRCYEAASLRVYLVSDGDGYVKCHNCEKVYSRIPNP